MLQNSKLEAMRFALAVPRQQLLLNRTLQSKAGSRLRCRATAGSDTRGIFNVDGHGSNVTVFDARCCCKDAIGTQHGQKYSANGVCNHIPLARRDAIESCSNCEDADATACFAFFGCDRHRVERWYHVVAGLEQTLAMPGARTAYSLLSAPCVEVFLLLVLCCWFHMSKSLVPNVSFIVVVSSRRTDRQYLQLAALHLSHVSKFACITG